MCTHNIQKYLDLDCFSFTKSTKERILPYFILGFLKHMIYFAFYYCLFLLIISLKQCQVTVKYFSYMKFCL